MPVWPDTAIATALPPIGDKATLQPPQSTDALPEFPDCTTEIAPVLAIAIPTASPVDPLPAVDPGAAPLVAPESPEAAVVPAIPDSVSATDNALPVEPELA